MADFENNNTGMNNNMGNTGAGTPNSANDPYAYQNGYYRNPTPHQDEAVHSGAGSANSYSAGNAAQTPPPNGGSNGNNGYTYVNYYSDPNGSTPGDPRKKPKKKHTGLKVTACVLAMALISGASIGIYEGIRSSLDSEDTVVSDVTAEKDDSKNETSKNNAESSNAQESWIQLASTSGAMSVADIVKKVTPSVVGVQATFASSNTGNNYYGGFFGYGNQNSGTQQATGVGTGIVMSKDGYIVTNAHVIYDDEYGYGEATAVQVQMSDQETVYDARVVAYDKEADIAVLKIEAKDLTPAEFGDSSSCEVGEMVVAIGNPLGLEFQNTVTCGIISALNRQVTINDNTMTLIQTDTAINSGNSGGPLINSAGQVIGINSAKMSSTYSGQATVEGIGFAIPMSEAKIIIDDLINYGYVTGRPQLGITCQDVSEAVSQAYHIPVGAYIISVTEGGAADAAGLQPADVITAIQDQEITTTEELNAVKNEYNAGDTVTLTVVRSGEEMKVDVTLEEVTASQN
ncbi:S1C family serine protease [uncultured Ruminococcus sp.]|uniref:S1C family serine protease n=1 Tax=uncultured Ruminococcus sp. TaxID=165186 RepID=UPI00260EB9E7|nr:trypsin-like peptidase domain-containing protein [uncultured Ruminococcus sp.]